jgi:YD repeat-containing protein
VCLLCLLVSNGVRAQLKTITSIPSPNATELGVYGETPVSLYTGTPAINIPLYQLKEGDLSLPVSLSYNASGARPDQHPGWVGQNWSLNAGGVITRVVKGIPDETAWTQHVQFFDSYNSKFNIGNTVGYNYWTSKLQNTGWNTFAYVDGLARSTQWVDTEPDEYIFNFNGYAGKFYLGEDGQYKVVSDPSIRVEIEDTLLKIPYTSYLVSPAIQTVDGYFNPSEYKVKGFRITTPDGVQYEFGNWNTDQTKFANLAIEASVNFFQEGYFGENWNTWYLKRIVSASGADQIRFTYEPGYVSVGSGVWKATAVASFTRTISFDKKQGTGERFGLFGIFGPVSASSKQISNRYDGQLIYAMYLTKIETRNTTLKFTISPTDELTYKYNSILADLSSQASFTYQSGLHCLPSRSVVAATSLTKPGVGYYPRSDIKLRDPLNGNWNVTNIVHDYYYNASYGAFNDIYSGIFDIDGGFNAVEAIDFNFMRWFKLDKMEVLNKNTQEQAKSFIFGYNNNASERLMLMSVKQEGQNSAGNPPYSFEYEDYNSNYYTGTDKLPDYNSFKVDHWGFFNGTDSWIGLDFDNPTTLQAYKAKREPVAQYLYAGQLNKITYPTGGYTRFTYEPHQYEQMVVRDATTGAFSLPAAFPAKTAGGLRIKEIRSNPNSGNPEIVKTYEYSGGILGGDNQYYWPGYQGRFLESSATYTADRFITQTLLPVSGNSAGSHIGYSKVVEKTAGNGRVEYLYSNHHTNLDENFQASIDPNKSPYSPFTDKQLERGKLLEANTYSEAGTLLSKEKNIYTANPSRLGEFIRAVATQQYQVFSGWGIEGTAYKVYTYPYNLSRKETTLYDQSGSGSQLVAVDLGYNARNLTSSSTKTQSNGAVVVNSYKYPSDYASSAMGGVMGQLQTKNILGQVIEERVNENSLTVSGKVNQYNNDGQLIAEHLFEALSPVSGLPFSTTNIIPSTTYYKQRTAFSYDPTSKNLTSQQLLGDVLTSYLWGYNQKLAIAEVKNAASNKILHTSFEEETDAARFSTDIRTGKKSLKVAYTVTLPSAGNYVLSYWRKLTGATTWELVQQTVSANTTIGGTTMVIDEVRLFPAGAEMTTYTYDPIFGVTTVTDPTNITTYYEYDGMGRLRYVKNQDGDIINNYVYHYKN